MKTKLLEDNPIKCFIGKFQFKKFTKNFLIHFLLSAFEKKNNEFYCKDLLNCFYLKTGKNLFFIETFSSSNHETMQKIFKSRVFFFDWAIFDKKIRKIFHIFSFFDVTKSGDLIKVKTGNYREFFGIIKKFINMV
jgi:hypothetical protein